LPASAKQHGGCANALWRNGESADFSGGRPTLTPAQQSGGSADFMAEVVCLSPKVSTQTQALQKTGRKIVPEAEKSWKAA